MICQRLLQYCTLFTKQMIRNGLFHCFKITLNIILTVSLVTVGVSLGCHVTVCCYVRFLWLPGRSTAAVVRQWAVQGKVLSQSSHRPSLRFCSLQSKHDSTARNRDHNSKQTVPRGNPTAVKVTQVNHLQTIPLPQASPIAMCGYRITNAAWCRILDYITE